MIKINDTTKQKLDEFAKNNHIKYIVLFGSQAKGAVREDSDFDIAVLTMGEKNIGNDLNYYTEILFGLCEILKVPDYRMDLTNLNNANILLCQEIIKEGKLLFGDENGYEDYRAFSFREFIDAKSLFGLEEFLITKRQKLLKEILTR